MASLVKDPNGSFRIEVVVPDGSRKRVRLGKVPVKTAESWHRRVEALVSDLAAGEPHGRDLAAWLTESPSSSTSGWCGRAWLIGERQPRR